MAMFLIDDQERFTEQIRPSLKNVTNLFQMVPMIDSGSQSGYLALKRFASQ